MATKYVPGYKVGRLTIVERLPNRSARCKCDCGNETTVHLTNLPTGNTRSCGCIHREYANTPRSHGMAKTPTYRSWSMMKNRCRNPNHDKASYYAGRGIKMCDRWERFENFLEDMGERPDGHSIDRIDNNGNYEPGNCRWATHSQQMRNTRRSNQL